MMKVVAISLIVALCVAVPVEKVAEEAKQPVAAEKINMLAAPTSKGTKTLMAGTETIIQVPSGITNPILFLAPVPVTGENAELSPAIVTRSKLVDNADGSKSFHVVSGVAPCAYQSVAETVAFLIVEADTTADVKVVTGSVTPGESGSNIDIGDFGDAICVPSIQTRNSEGFLRAQANPAVSGKVKVVLSGTNSGAIRNDLGLQVMAAGAAAETVALLCVHPPAAGATASLAAGASFPAMDVSVQKTGDNTGLFGISSIHKNKHILAGVQKDSDCPSPLHARGFASIAAGGDNRHRLFKLERDGCPNPEQFAEFSMDTLPPTSVLLVSFQ